MQKTTGWFQYAKRWVLVTAWVLMVAFVVSWIYAYDTCVRGPGFEQIGCLTISLVAAYFGWLILAAAVAGKIVQILL